MRAKTPTDFFEKIITNPNISNGFVDEITPIFKQYIKEIGAQQNSTEKLFSDFTDMSKRQLAEKDGL